MALRTLSWVLFKASRPSQLLLIVGVYLLGTKIALANGATADRSTVVLGAIPLLAIAASVHYANEYADYDTDARTDRTPFSGGSGAIHRTTLDRSVLLSGALGTLALGVISMGVLAVSSVLSPPAVGLLVVIAIVGWQYSVGPLRLAWRGMGEVTNAFLGGLVLPVYGSAVLADPSQSAVLADPSQSAVLADPSPTVALASIPFFLVVLLNLFATQWPDREADAAVGKRTLAVRWSRPRLRLAYALIAISAGVSLLALHTIVLPTAVVLASLLVTPLVCVGAWGYTRRHVPWPTVTAMVGLAVLQFIGWCVHLR